jgi:hypothetical protein
MREPSPGVEGQDWVRVRARCQGCGGVVEIRAVPGRRDQRWACPACHHRHSELTEV